MRFVTLLCLCSVLCACEGNAGNAAPDFDAGASSGGGGNTGETTNGGDGSGANGEQNGGDSATGGGTVTPSCQQSWAERLSVTTVDVEADISHLVSGYDGFPVLDRIELSVSPNGRAQIAWLTDDRTSVHVTPLDEKLERAGEDVIIPGVDLGGFVAHDDGFALLTRRDDPGSEVAIDESEKPNRAALLVRYRDGKEQFTSFLTGTSGVDQEKDFSNGLNGALRWNGKVYGSYFVIRGGKGHWAEGHYGDKLVYVDGIGKAQKGGWGWNCSHNEGIRLLAEPERFTPLCFSDAYPNAGLNLVIEGRTHYLAPEQNWAGYTAGNFGSILRLPDQRYMIAWSSKGDGGIKKSGDVPEIAPAKQTSDIAFAYLDQDRQPSGTIKWLTNTQEGVAELDVRLAPYGSNVLAMWQRIEQVPDDKAMPFGKNAGTRVQLLSAEGEPLGKEEGIEGAPTWNAELATLPNGDLVWAYALEERATDASYRKPAALRRLRVARLAVCE